MSTWRDRAKPIITHVLLKTQGESEKVIRKALKAAYPFTVRQYHPYRIWCSEIRRQRGLEVPKQKDSTGPVETPLFPG